jgi:hypothetical protein
MPPGFYGFLISFTLIAIGGFLYQKRNIIFGERRGETKMDQDKKNKSSNKNSKYPEEEYKDDEETRKLIKF